MLINESVCALSPYLYLKDGARGPFAQNAGGAPDVVGRAAQEGHFSLGFSYFGRCIDARLRLRD
jgi:hypothetical protein